MVQFHGYSGNSGDWCDKLNYVSAGFTVASLDVRGQGGPSQDVTPVTGTTLRGHIIRGVDDPDPKKLLFRNIFLDTARTARIVMAMDDVDETRVGAMGGSQGGGLTLACAALVPELNRASATFPFLSDYRRVWNMDLAKAAYDELQYYFRWFDPTHAREEEFFRRLGYIDVQNLAPRIPLPDHDGDRAHGYGLPAVDAVRRLQQDHGAERARVLPGLRPRRAARTQRPRVPVHDGHAEVRGTWKNPFIN